MNLLIVFVMSIESVKLMLSILYCISNVFYQVSILFYNQSCVVSTPGDNFQFFLIGFRINSDYAKDTYSSIFSIFF